MLKLTPHEISVRTRRALDAVIKRYSLEEEPLKKFGLLDRIVRGYLHACEGNVHVIWPKEPPLPEEIEYHIVAEVTSSRDEGKRKWGRPYKVGGKFVLDDSGLKDYEGYELYVLEDIGGAYSFSKRGSHEVIVGHGCDDGFFQAGLKGIPTACYHACAVRFVAPLMLNKSAEEMKSDRKIKFIGEYGPIEDALVDLYKEMEHHRLSSAQRVNLLYACSKDELGIFNFGKDFLKSVKPFLEEPLKQQAR